MRIFLIWLAVIACSVANGYFFSDFGSPEKFVFIFCSSLACAGVLLIHRKVTKDWKAPIDPWTGNYCFPIFRVSMFIGLLMVLVLFVLPEFHRFWVATSITFGIASFIAYTREQKYTDEWL